MAVDPVCKMTVDEHSAAGKSEYNGKTYYFCAAVCKTRFDHEPQKYVKTCLITSFRRATAPTSRRPARA